MNVTEVINIKSIGVSRNFNYNFSTTNWTHIYYSRYTEIQYLQICHMPEIISEIGYMKYKHLSLTVQFSVFVSL